MNRGARSVTVLALALLATTIAPLRAHYGNVTDERGKPLAGARACYIVAGGGEALCVETDKAGHFQLPRSRVPTIRISADGYLPVNIPAAPRDVPVRLQRAASLRVTLLDGAKEKPISPAEIYVTRPSGKRLGPLPTGNAGIMLFRTLEPGPIRVSASADGYQAESGVAVELVGGEQADVVIRLTPSDPAAPAR